MRSVVDASILAAAMAVMVAVPSTAMAQMEAPNVAQVTVVQIDGVNLDAFMERIKKAQAIWKELGMPAFRAWQSTLAGPNTGAVVFVTLYDDNVAWAKAQQKLAASAKWQKWIDDLQGWGETTISSSSLQTEITP